MVLREHPKPANTALGGLIAAAKISRHALAHLVNTLAERAVHTCSYTHTSVANWTHRGMIPKHPGARVHRRDPLRAIRAPSQPLRDWYARNVTTGRRHILRLAKHWPWTDVITEAVQQLAALPNPG
jgi:hypothetical protein